MLPSSPAVNMGLGLELAFCTDRIDTDGRMFGQRTSAYAYCACMCLISVLTLQVVSHRLQRMRSSVATVRVDQLQRALVRRYVMSCHVMSSEPLFGGELRIGAMQGHRWNESRGH